MTNPLMMIDLFDAWMLTVLVGKVMVSELIAGFSQAEELRVTEPGLAVITCDNPAVGVSFFAYNSLLQGNAPACRGAGGARHAQQGDCLLCSSGSMELGKLPPKSFAFSLCVQSPCIGGQHSIESRSPRQC